MVSSNVVERVRARYPSEAPKLAALLDKLQTRVLAEDGSAVLRFDEREAKQAAEQLHKARRGYLDAMVLYTEATEMVNQEGEAVEDFRDVLLRAETAQRLRLPPPAFDASEPSTSYILGLQPHNLLRQSEQGDLAAVIPRVEARLVDKCKLVGRLLASNLASHRPSSSTTTAWMGNDITSTDPHEVSATLASMVDDIAPAQQVAYLSGQISELQNLIYQLHQTLHSVAEVYVKLIEEHKLSKQFQRNRVISEVLTKQHQATYAKLDQIHHQILEKTYTKETIPALKKAHQLLTSAGEMIEARCLQAQAEVMPYKGVDADFDELAKEYAMIEKEIKQCEQVLRELNQDLEETKAHHEQDQAHHL